jgi:hypothetical protein
MARGGPNGNSVSRQGVKSTRWAGNYAFLGARAPWQSRDLGHGAPPRRREGEICMRFNLFLTSYYPDLAYGGKRHFDDLIAQAVLADRLGFDAVSLPEHHLINILMMPSPLQMAVKLAGLTEKVELITAVAVLPLRDMRIFAGEVAQADMLCDGRLFLGVGRGAFG